MVRATADSRFCIWYTIQDADQLKQVLNSC